MEHLRAVNEVALTRTNNWQAYCMADTDLFLFLVQLAVQLDEAIAPVLLQVRVA